MKIPCSTSGPGFRPSPLMGARDEHGDLTRATGRVNPLTLTLSPKGAREYRTTSIPPRPLGGEGRGEGATGTMLPLRHSARPATPLRIAAFTMVEIALCLGIIGFALVAIIGVLPLGLNTQKDNRADTIINKD